MKQPEALRLAQGLEQFAAYCQLGHGFEDEDAKAAAELRRLHALNAELVDALEVAQKDAERYRWLRDDPPLSLAVRRHPGETGAGCYLDGPSLDAAIDAAMKGQE